MEEVKKKFLKLRTKEIETRRKNLTCERRRGGVRSSDGGNAGCVVERARRSLYCGRFQEMACLLKK